MESAAVLFIPVCPTKTNIQESARYGYAINNFTQIIITTKAEKMTEEMKKQFDAWCLKNPLRTFADETFKIREMLQTQAST